MHDRRNAIWLLLTALLLIGLGTGRAVFFSLAYLFFGLMMLSLIWSWVAMRGVRIGRRTHTRRAQVGQEFREGFTVRNASILPKLWLEVRDHSNLPGYRASYVTAPIAPFRQRNWQATAICTARGEFRLGPMTIASGDPFGFFLTPRHISASEHVIVYPATVPISQFKLTMGTLPGGDPQRHISRHITTNVSGVREYIPGDSIKRIHWKSSARLGQLMVKEYERDPMIDVWLMVDFSAEALVEDESVRRIGDNGAIIHTHESRLPASTEEYSAVIAASLAQYFITAERALGFVTYTPHREVLQPGRGHRQLTNIMETLAVARSLSQRTLKEMITLETPYIRRGASVVIITSTLDVGWIPQLHLLARRGIRPTCVFIDPTTFGKPGTSDELLGSLNLARVPTLRISKGNNLSLALSQRPLI
jgi:uncharacterized protein (DUF58 family)